MLEEEGAREKIRIKVEASEALVKTAAAPPKNEDVSDQAATEKDSEDVSSSSSNHKNASEEDVEDENEAGEVDPCPCVADQECSPDRMDFTFGKSCSFGHVRCCPAEKEDTGARETVINIHDQEEGHFEEDRRKSQNTPKVDLPYQVVPRDEEEAEATKDGPGFAFTRHFVPKHQPTIGSMIPNVLGKDAFTFPSLVTGGAPSRLPMDPELKQDGPVSSEPMADEEQVKKSDDFDKNSNPSPVQHRVAFPDSSQSTLILPNRVIDGISPRNPIRVTQQQLLTFPRPHPQLFAPELKRGDHMSPKPLATDKQEKNSNDNMVEHRLNPTQEQTNLPDSPPRSQNMPMRVYSGIPHIRQQQQFPSSRPHTQFVPEQKRANLNPPRPHTPQFDPEQKQDNQVSPGLPANDDKPQISNENNLSKSIDPAPQKVTYPDSSQRNPQHPVRVHYGISPGNPPQSTPPRQFPSVRPHPQVIVPPVGNGFKMAPLRPPVFVNRVSSDVPEPHQPSSPTREAPKSADGPTAAVDDAGSDPELERRRYHEMLARRQMAAEQEMMRIRNANHRDSIQRSQAEPVSFMGRLNKAIFSLGKGFQDLIG